MHAVKPLVAIMQGLRRKATAGRKHSRCHTPQNNYTMKILLVTPPFVQLNTPYPATTELKAHLVTKGHEVTQCDLSIETAERIFSREFLEDVFREAFERDRLSFGAQCVASQKERYLGTVDAVWSFLRGDDDTLAPLIASPDYLPRGRRFAKQDDDTLEWAFGTCGTGDMARHIATLYIEDLSDFIAEIVSLDFSPVRYGEQLALSAASFDKIYDRVKGGRNAIDSLMCDIFIRKMETIRPDMVGFSVPFPGTLTSALMLSDAAAKEGYGAIRVMGGGYVNTELRSLSDGRIFDFVDFITFDDGQLPTERLCDLKEGRCTPEDLVRTVYRRKDGTIAERLNTDCNIPFGQLPPPDFSDFDRSRYVSLTELTNPMHKLWSDGRWNKMTVAHGCYHRRCAFCDTSLDYIGRWDAPSPETVVERMEHIVAQTGIRGFHFTDEALPPALLSRVCRLIVERGITVTWWGNIRFEESYTPELCALMRQAGCIAVSGGMEVAHQRVLSLIGKGITVEGARRCAANFADAGIMVHAYLMYGFPTQTVEECGQSLETVRDMFADGSLQSAFWHRFALTVHSPVGMHPERYGCRLLQTEPNPFANNAVEYTSEGDDADWDAVGQGLARATYNYMLGTGYDLPIRNWLPMLRKKGTGGDNNRKKRNNNKKDDSMRAARANRR